MEPPAVTIRPALAADLPAILDIEKYCRTVTWGPAAFHNELVNENNINLVACAQNKAVCGFVFAILAADELEINTLAVGPAFQRLGIARRLLSAAAETGLRRGARSVHLEVRSKNKPAIGLYTRLGFMVRWVRKKYYSDDGDDAIVMSISIDTAFPLRPAS